MDRLVRVGAFANHGEAHAARGYLEGHGVNAEVSGVDETHPSVSFSQVVLLVPDDQVGDARRLLAEFDDESESSGALVFRTELLVAGGILLLLILVLLLLSVVS